MLSVARDATPHVVGLEDLVLTLLALSQSCATSSTNTPNPRTA